MGARRGDQDAATEFVDYLLDQLRAWGPVAPRRMFGGHGLFRNGTMFALVLDEALYLRADAATRDEFLAAGMEPFRYDRLGKSVALGFHAVPADLLEEPDELARWTDKAYAAALRVAARKPKAAKPEVAKAKAAKAKVAKPKAAGAGSTPRERKRPGDRPAQRRVKHAE